MSKDRHSGLINACYVIVNLIANLAFHEFPWHMGLNVNDFGV